MVAVSTHCNDMVAGNEGNTSGTSTVRNAAEQDADDAAERR